MAEPDPTTTGMERSITPAGVVGKELSGSGAWVAESSPPAGWPEVTDWSNSDTLVRQLYTVTDSPSWLGGCETAPVRTLRSNC